jgi:hypothetical protein
MSLNITETRAILQGIALSAKQFAEQTETLAASLSEQKLDGETLDNLMSLFEATDGIITSTSSALEGLNRRHQAMEEAVNTTAHAADTHFYRTHGGNSGNQIASQEQPVVEPAEPNVNAASIAARPGQAATAPIGMTGWQLVAVTASRSGVPCDHCGRVLKRLFTVRNPDRRQMIVGRGCVKKLTGWTLEAAEAERMLKWAALQARRAVAWSRFAEQRPDLAALIDADITAYERGVPAHIGAGASHQIKTWICDGQVTGSFLENRITDYLRRRDSFYWIKNTPDSPEGK